MEEILELAREKGYRQISFGQNPRTIIIGESEKPSAKELDYQNRVISALKPKVIIHHRPYKTSRQGTQKIIPIQVTEEDSRDYNKIISNSQYSQDHKRQIEASIRQRRAAKVIAEHSPPEGLVLAILSSAKTEVDSLLHITLQDLRLPYIAMTC